MIANKKSMRRSSPDPHDAPDLSKKQWQEKFAKADLMAGNKVVRRGRPPAPNPKVSTTVRLDSDILEHFRAGGPGWQTRLNATLRKAVRL